MKTPRYLATLLRSAWRIARSDWALFRRFPRLWIAAIAIAFVPAAYALIYLSSVWDPSAKTNALPVGIVNLDEGFSHQGRVTNVGAELTGELMRAGTFGFRVFDDSDAARQAVRQGRLAFAVIFPKDFSANAIPGVRPGDARVTVVFSEGNNYAAASFARRFAAELGHQVNETLNEKRWEQVLMSVDGSGKNLGKLTAGMVQLRTGAQALSDGMGRYSSAATQVVSGFKQVGAGIRTLEAALPLDEDLKTLKAGAQRLALRQRDMGTGLGQLEAGARKLTEGAAQMQQQTADIPFIGERLAANAGELAAGGGQLTEGLTTALDANARLARGASRVEAGVVRLTDGMGAMGEGIHRMADKLPEDSRLDALSRGGVELARGAAKLRAGIELIGAELPDFGSSAKGLADSVEPTLEVLAPVANNGSAFAPNMVAMALWLGAVMAVYLFNLHALSVEHAAETEFAKTLGRFAVPSMIVLVQTVLTFLMLVYGLGIAVPNLLSFTFSMLVAGQAFLAIIYLLLRALGEAGKLLVVLLLTLQLAAGGGVMPIELSGGFFQAVHDWLPFTWVIKAFRGSLFGAYDSAWLHSLADVILSGVLALMLATFVKRWHTVPAQDYLPGIEV